MDNKGIKRICAFTLLYNEEDFLPYYLNHYIPIVDAFYFVDMGCTDESLNIIKSTLSKHKKYHEIIKNRLDEHREDIMMMYRNHYYKYLTKIYDWFIICDVDEIVYAPDLRNFLQQTNDDVFKCSGYDIVHESAPSLCKNIISQIDIGHKNTQDLTKCCVFRKNVEINYGMGCHSASPRNIDPFEKIRINDNTMYLFHHKYYDRQRFIKNTLQKYKRRKGYALRTRHGYHYKDDINLLNKQFDEKIKISSKLQFNFIDV